MTNAQPILEDNAQGEPTVATVGAVLAVDIGSLHTRAVLFDILGGEYRFIARASAATTAEAPFGDVTAGVSNAVRELEQITGRRLTDDTRLRIPQRRDGSGIDLFIATSSAAPALRLVVAAVSKDISERSAMQAARSAYTQVVSRITLDEGIEKIASEEDERLTTATAWLQEETDKLLALPPDVVLVAGGVDDGPVLPLVRLAKVISGAAREQGRKAERIARMGRTAPGLPAVILAGNVSSVESVKSQLAPLTEIRNVSNLRPGLHTEQTGPAEAALAGLYRERRVPQIPGYSVLSRWVEGPVVPTAEATRLIARYLNSFYKRETLIADVGASSTSLFLASDERDHAVILGDMGMAYTLGNVLAERGVENVRRWLPFVITEGELTDWVLNKVVRALSLPQTARDLAIEHALAREALIAGADALKAYNGGRTPRYDLLVGTGGLLAHAPRPGQAALMLLDALQPTAESLGSVELAVDTTMLIPPLANLARHHLSAAAYIFDRDCLAWLGTAIVVQGTPPARKESRRGATAEPSEVTAVTVTIERQGGGTETVAVPYGSIRALPLRPDQRASLKVEPGPGFSIGSGAPGKPLKTQPGQEVKGGLVGLIIDARGRDPMRLPSDPNVRAATIRRWWADMDAIPTGESFGRAGEQESTPPEPDGEQPQP
jgi:hypothetical protein